MSDKVDQAAQAVTDAVQSGGLDDFMARMGEAIQYVSTKIVDVGVQAAELVLNLVQMKSIFALVVSLIVIVATLVVRSKAYNWLVSQEQNTKSEDKIFIGVMSWIPTVAIVAYPMTQLLSFYNWAGAIYPAAAIAMKALEAAGINL